MSIDTSHGHAAMDYPEHRRTYAGFLRGAQVLTAGVIAVLAGMAFFLL